MRTLSTAASNALNAQASSAVFPFLIEIIHAGMSTLRFANNSTDLTYDGNVYYAFPFTFDPPDETEDQISNAKLTICSVDQTVIAALRSISSEPPTVTVKAMFYFDEGSVTFEPIVPWTFTLRSITFNAQTVSGDLVYEERLDLAAPSTTFDPFLFPGVF